MADIKPKYHSDTWLENDDVTTEAKKVKLWGYNADATGYVKVAVNAAGELKSSNVLAEYAIADLDTTPGTQYNGYLRADGAWYIQRQVTSGTDIAYTYVKGASGYDFSNRASESYVSFDSAF